MAHVTAAIGRQDSLAVALHAGLRGRPVSSTPSTDTSSADTSAAATDFQKLFSGQTAAAPQAAAPATTTSGPPTAEQVFGANPWLADPIGKNPDGSTFSYNPIYFATPQTAAAVAQMVGGTVVSSNEFSSPGSPFIQQQPNLMVQLPSGKSINAGLIASFYTHGYPQSYIDGLIANAVSEAEA